MSHITRNGFGVSVSVNGRNMPYMRGDNDSYFVPLASETRYGLRLSNMNKTICDTEVFIDDEPVGIFRIEALSNILIDRPDYTNRSFTFISETSAIGTRLNVMPSEENGLVVVKFYPKRSSYYSHYPVASVSRARESLSSMPSSLMKQSAGFGLNVGSMIEQEQQPSMPMSQIASKHLDYSIHPQITGGVTILGAESSQTFDKTKRIPEEEIDHNNITIITLRLVALSHRIEEEKPYYTRLGRQDNVISTPYPKYRNNHNHH